MRLRGSKLGSIVCFFGLVHSMIQHAVNIILCINLQAFKYSSLCSLQRIISTMRDLYSTASIRGRGDLRSDDEPRNHFTRKRVSPTRHSSS